MVLYSENTAHSDSEYNVIQPFHRNKPSSQTDLKQRCEQSLPFCYEHILLIAIPKREAVKKRADSGVEVLLEKHSLIEISVHLSCVGVEEAHTNKCGVHKSKTIHVSTYQWKLSEETSLCNLVEVCFSH